MTTKPEEVRELIERSIDCWEAFVAAEIETQMQWWDAEGRAMPRTKTGEYVLAFAACCGATEALRRLRFKIGGEA